MEGGGGLQSIYNPITRLIRPVLYRNRVKRANTNQRNVNKNIAIFVSNVELSIIARFSQFFQLSSFDLLNLFFQQKDWIGSVACKYISRLMNLVRMTNFV